MCNRNNIGKIRKTPTSTKTQLKISFQWKNDTKDFKNCCKIPNTWDFSMSIRNCMWGSLLSAAVTIYFIYEHLLKHCLQNPKKICILYWTINQLALWYNKNNTNLFKQNIIVNLKTLNFLLLFDKGTSKVKAALAIKAVGALHSQCFAFTIKIHKSNGPQ